MAIAAAVKRFLDGQGIVYQVASHARTITLEEAAEELGIRLNQIARSVILQDNLGVVMAVLPVTHRLDFHRLKNMLQRDLELVTGTEADKWFKDCEPGSRPPVAEAYGIACVVDTSLTQCDDVYFEPGTHNALVHVSSHGFKDILTKALKGEFAYPVCSTSVAVAKKRSQQGRGTPCLSSERSQIDVECLQRHMHDQYRLPNIPLMMELLDIYQQAEVVRTFDCQDQLVAYPQMEEILLTFTNHVLGSKQTRYHSLANLWQEGEPAVVKSALALASGVLAAQALRSEVQGPFANKIIWRHALFSASLAHAAAEVVGQRCIEADLAFFAALMQNTGVLLLGYLFKPEYQLLNRLGAANPGTTMELLERKMIGMGKAHDIISLGHERLGAWLLKTWSFPEAVVEVAEQHHNPLLTKDHDAYLHLVHLVNHLLSEQGYEQLQDREGPFGLSCDILGLKTAELLPIQDNLLKVRPAIERILNLV